jgi:hypothetical protein
MGRRRRWTDEEFLKAVAANRSLAGMLRDLGLSPGGGVYVEMHRHIARLGADTSHWKGQGWRRGNRTPMRPPVPLDELLVAGRHSATHRLKARLLAAGLLDRRCAICGLTEWQGRAAPLQLDHQNGDRSDNRLANLRLLCPNCHAQTDTYCGKNIGRTRGRE